MPQGIAALLAAVDNVFQVVDALLLHFRFLGSFRRILVKAIPLKLPAGHLLLGLGQGSGGRLFTRAGGLQLGLNLGNLAFQGRDLVHVQGQFLLEVLQRFLDFTQVQFQLLLALPLVLDVLLDAGYFTAQGIVGALNFLIGVIGLDAFLAHFLHVSFQRPRLGHTGFQFHTQLGDFLLGIADRFIQPLPAQGLQVGRGITLLLLVFLVAFRGTGLALQMLQLALELFANVGQAFEVFAGALDAVFRFPASFLVLGNACCFLDEDAQFFRLGFDQVRHHALLDDRVAPGTETGTEEDILDIATAALGAVEHISGLRLAVDDALDRDFVEGGVFALHRVVGVVENELDGGLANRFAVAGAVEDHVRKIFTTQLARRAFTHDPAYGIDNIGFAATIGADDGAKITGEVDCGRVYERLESCEFNAF